MGTGNIFQRGTCCASATLGGYTSDATAYLHLASGPVRSNGMGRMSAMREGRHTPHHGCPLGNTKQRWELEMPALRVGDQKVAKYLDTRHRFEFFRIYEIGIERERVGFTE